MLLIFFLDGKQKIMIKSQCNKLLLERTFWWENRLDKKKPQFLDKLKSLLVVIIDKNQKVMILIKILSLLVLAEGRDYNLEVKRLTLLQRKKLMYLFSMMGHLNKILHNFLVLNRKNKTFKLSNTIMQG